MNPASEIQYSKNKYKKFIKDIVTEQWRDLN